MSYILSYVVPPYQLFIIVICPNFQNSKWCDDKKPMSLDFRIVYDIVSYKSGGIVIKYWGDVRYNLWSDDIYKKEDSLEII